MCEHCKNKVETSLSSINNVSKVKVNLKDKTATIYSTASINNEDIEKIIKKLDYQIISIGEDK